MDQSGALRPAGPTPTATATLVIACVVLVVLVAAVIYWSVTAASYTLKIPGTGRIRPRSTGPIGTIEPNRSNASQQWAVVGAGVAAAAFLNTYRALTGAGGAESSIRFHVAEAGVRAGGRALTTVAPITPVSTATAPREFAAWIFRAAPGDRTTTFLSDIGVQSTPIDLLTPGTFVWDAGARRPLGPLPATQFLDAGPGTPTAALWLAHTGFTPQVAPGAADDLMRAQDVPVRASVPTGFGWQDVVLRGIGSTPVVYGRLLETVTPGRDGRVTLGYASGDVEVVDGVVLTLPPRELLGITTLPAAARAAITRSFITVSEGVLYATWGGTTSSWFSAVGFTAGMVMTTLPVGRVCRTTTGEVRCTMSGNANVAFWNDLLVVQGQQAAGAAMAAQLRQVFGDDTIPAPDNMAFRGWHDAVGFWTVPAQERAAIQLQLSRPWGPGVPIYWASSDLSTTPGWVEGAIESGQLSAAAIVAAAPSGSKPPRHHRP